jgi:hypothetical protein
LDLPANASSCICDSCSESGCTLDFTSIARQVHMLSMNCLKRVLRFEGRICDCAVLWKNEGRVAAIELKGGQNANVGQLVEQLQGGLNLLDNLTQGQSVSEVMPILLYSGDREIDSALAKRRVTFRGDKRRIIIGPCGSRLAGFLSSTRRRGTSQRPRSHRRRS